MNEISNTVRECLGVFNGRHRIMEIKYVGVTGTNGRFMLKRCVGRIYTQVGAVGTLSIDIVLPDSHKQAA